MSGPEDQLHPPFFPQDRRLYMPADLLKGSGLAVKEHLLH